MTRLFLWPCTIAVIALVSAPADAFAQHLCLFDARHTSCGAVRTGPWHQITFGRADFPEPVPVFVVHGHGQRPLPLRRATSGMTHTLSSGPGTSALQRAFRKAMPFVEMFGTFECPALQFDTRGSGPRLGHATHGRVAPPPVTVTPYPCRSK